MRTEPQKPSIETNYMWGAPGHPGTWLEELWDLRTRSIQLQATLAVLRQEIPEAAARPRRANAKRLSPVEIKLDAARTQIEHLWVHLSRATASLDPRGPHVAAEYAKPVCDLAKQNFEALLTPTPDDDVIAPLFLSLIARTEELQVILRTFPSSDRADQQESKPAQTAVFPPEQVERVATAIRRLGESSKANMIVTECKPMGRQRCLAIRRQLLSRTKN